MWGIKTTLYVLRGDHVSAPLSQQKSSSRQGDRSLMYKKPWLTYLCDVVCWIATSAVHRFEWNSSVVKAVIIVTGVHLNLSTLFVASRFLSAKLFPEWRLNPDFGTQKRCPFPLNRCVPSTEVTDTKLMWTFFRDQILCPLNGGVPWIKVSQRRRSTVPVQCFESTCIYVIVWPVWLNRVCSFRHGLKDVKDLFTLHELDVKVIYDR